MAQPSTEEFLTRKILGELRAVLPSLEADDKQGKVIAHVLAHPFQVARSTISELAETLGVSESTIVKVCKKVGLAGFKDLKRALRAAAEDRAGAIAEEIEPSDDVATVIGKMFGNALEDIQDTLAVLDAGAMRRAADAVAHAGRIGCYGVGGSGPLALDAHHKFMLTGYRAIAFTDVHLALMSAALLEPGDVALVFSYAGETRAVNALVRVAKRQGATTIAITTRRPTTLTGLVDIALFASARELPMTGENSTVRLVQKLVLDCLFACVIKNDQARVQAAFRKTTAAIEEV